MSDLWNATAPPPVRPQFNEVKAVLIVAAIAILAIGAFNVFSASHSPRPVPSTLKAQQLQAALPAPVDPNAFNEDRDGSNALSLEDENGKATIWQDTTSGSRIFCLDDSCTMLPASHRHHRNK